MKNKFPAKFHVILSVIAVIAMFSFYLYKNVLPYTFPNQWEPSTEDLYSIGEYDPGEVEGEFLGQKVRSYELSLDTEAEESSLVLGKSDSKNKRIDVDLSKQKVYAYEGNKKVMEFLISSGKWGKTPTGEFTIEYKTKAQKMSGGSKALGTYYYLPNVQFVQFFGNKQIPWSRGFGFHGTYWHNNFGTPMSHGCINMRNEDAKQLFNWTNPSMGSKGTVKASKDSPGTKVRIYGRAPK